MGNSLPTERKGDCLPGKHKFKDFVTRCQTPNCRTPATLCPYCGYRSKQQPVTLICTKCNTKQNFVEPAFDTNLARS